MLVHGNRHLPCVQRPHTRCHSHHTRSLTHTSCLTHVHHTRGGTHPRCFNHTGGFAHTCRLSRARGFFPLRCPFHTRHAGKHARRHARHHTTRTRGLILTRGRTRGRTRGLSRGLWHTRCFLNTRGFIYARGLFHLRCPFYAWRAGKHALRHTRDHTTHTGSLPHTGSHSYLSPHTPGLSR